MAKLTGTLVKQKVNRAKRKNEALRDLMRRILNEESPRVQALLLAQMAHELGEQFATLVELDELIRGNGGER